MFFTLSDCLCVWCERIDASIKIIRIVQDLAKHVSTHINRNPVVSKLCRLFNSLDEIPLLTDSLDIVTERQLSFGTIVLDTFQYYVTDISYLDSESALKRIVKCLQSEITFVHAQFLIRAALRLLCHRCGQIRNSDEGISAILIQILRFHRNLKNQQSSFVNFENVFFV